VGDTLALALEVRAQHLLQPVGQALDADVQTLHAVVESGEPLLQQALDGGHRAQCGDRLGGHGEWIEHAS
jgi:hypothetical protein